MTPFRAYWTRWFASLRVSYAVFRFLTTTPEGEEHAVMAQFGANRDTGVINMAVVSAKGEPSFDIHKFTIEMEDRSCRRKENR
jgi:hypothetical protein